MHQQDATPEKVGSRLAIVREVLGLSQTQIAAQAGLAVNAWNNYETGRRRISVDAAISVAREFRLTLDYIYVGDTANLPHGLARAIEAVRTARNLEA